MAKLINLTPHALTLRDVQGADHIVPPSGIIARVTTVAGEAETVAEVPVPVFGRDSFGKVSGLPEAANDTILIVSMVVASALNCTRSDVVRPGTGPQDGAVRDEQGRIVAVTRLIRA